MDWVVGHQCPFYITSQPLWQDEEKVSFDEEWDIAHAAMDPIFQLDLGNRCGEVEGVVAQLVKDVFVAANLVHEDVMSQMDGNIDN